VEELLGRALDEEAPCLPYIGARAQLRPNAAATARSASPPSGRTKIARAFRQRSSRPSTWPSRTLPGTFIEVIVGRRTLWAISFPRSASGIAKNADPETLEIANTSRRLMFS
jgi:hypothetical protein